MHGRNRCQLGVNWSLFQTRGRRQQTVYSVSQKSPPLKFSDIFPNGWEFIFSPNFTRLLHVSIYAGLQIFIQLAATLVKLCHIKGDHYNVLKMSTIDRNARWVVALNMA